jgi:hypothetical protein
VAVAPPTAEEAFRIVLRASTRAIAAARRLEGNVRRSVSVYLRPREELLDLAGAPRTVFRRALERGNLLVAEATAREVGVLDLREALELTALIAEHDRPRSHRYSVRWLGRYLDGADAPTIADVAFIAACLAALGGPRHAEALSALRAVAGR